MAGHAADDELDCMAAFRDRIRVGPTPELRGRALGVKILLREMRTGRVFFSAAERRDGAKCGSGWESEGWGMAVGGQKTAPIVQIPTPILRDTLQIEMAEDFLLL